MKILFITSSAAAGGGPRHVFDWMNALKEHYHGELSIYLAAPDQGFFAELLRQNAVASFTLPERSFSWTDLKNLKRFVKEHGVRLVHSFGRAGGLYGRFLGMGEQIVFHSPQGLISSGLSQIAYDRAELALRPFTKKYVFGSVSETEQARMRFGARNGIIVPPIVDPPETLIVNESQISLKQKRPLKIGTIGRFVAHKRMVELARAVLELGEGFHLSIYGAGELQDELERIAHESNGQIKVCGLVDRWEALAEVDIFASWSISESFGLAAAEAMAVGVPCVLSDVSGHRDLAADGRAWLFDPSSREEFARVIHSMVNDEREREDKVKRAHQYIRLSCGSARVAEDLVRAYKSMQ